MNAPALEAMEDFRQAKLQGAIMGGKDGREYLEYLADQAWWDNPDQAAEVKTQIAASQANAGLPSNAPEGPDIDA